jgi:hypothetical protein
MLHQLPDHGGFLFFDEGQKFFEMLDTYKKGNADRVRTLQLKGGGKWTRELVNDNASKTCPWTHLPISGYTQPEPLEREINKTPNDGLLSRWQTVFPLPMFPTFGESCCGTDRVCAHLVMVVRPPELEVLMPAIGVLVCCGACNVQRYKSILLTMKVSPGAEGLSLGANGEKEVEEDDLHMQKVSLLVILVSFSDRFGRGTFSILPVLQIQ